jgi:hypothetical protein
MATATCGPAHARRAGRHAQHQHVAGRSVMKSLTSASSTATPRMRSPVLVSCTTWPSTRRDTAARRLAPRHARHHLRPDRAEAVARLAAHRRPVEAVVRHAEVGHEHQPATLRAPRRRHAGRRCGRSPAPAPRRPPAPARRPARPPRRRRPPACCAASRTAPAPAAAPCRAARCTASPSAASAAGGSAARRTPGRTGARAQSRRAEVSWTARFTHIEAM